MRKLKAGDKVRWENESIVRTLVRPCTDYDDSWYINDKLSSCSEKYLTLVKSASKFKAGQKVRVIANNNAHGFTIGDVVRLEKNEDEGTASKWKGFSLTNEKEKWYLNDNDIEPIEEQPKFKVGDKVEITEEGSHKFSIGEKGELIEFCNEDKDWLVDCNSKGYWVEPHQMKLVEDQSEPSTEITSNESSKEPLNHVTTSVLDVALRACGIGLPYEIIDKVIDLAELIQATEGKTTLKDIAELQAEWKNK